MIHTEQGHLQFFNKEILPLIQSRTSQVRADVVSLVRIPLTCRNLAWADQQRVPLLELFAGGSQGRDLRAEDVRPVPGKSPRMGAALARRTRGSGRNGTLPGRCMVLANRQAAPGAPHVAVRRPGSAQGPSGAELGEGAVELDGRADGQAVLEHEFADPEAAAVLAVAVIRFRTLLLFWPLLFSVPVGSRVL